MYSIQNEMNPFLFMLSSMNKKDTHTSGQNLTKAKDSQKLL